MSQTMRAAIVPAYILLCIVFGGSVQGHWGAATLQLLAIVMIGWSLLVMERNSLSGPAKGLLAVVCLTVLLVFLQQIPLPPGAWTMLPGRQTVMEGYALLGQRLPSLPVSLTPHDTAATAVTLLPPVAVLTAMLIARAYKASWLIYAILIGMVAGVLLGALQVGGAISNDSPWYLYRRTNYGYATGFFANSNHQGILLVISIPLLLFAIANLRNKSQSAKTKAAILLLGVSGGLTVLMGIVLNGSLAVLLLCPPVIVVSATLLMPKTRRSNAMIMLAALITLTGIALIYLVPLESRLGSSNWTSFNSRQTIWSNTVVGIKDNWLLGSGIGSFRRLYPQYEDQAAVTTTFVNHAHNDYLEILLETGIPGLLTLLLFLLWWAGRAVRVARMRAIFPCAWAAVIGSAALLLHSLVDYPLRTAALAAIMAALLALMAQPRIREDSDDLDLWPSRHISA